MENEQEKRQYLLIPLPLVRELFMPRHCADFILDYGLVDAAQRLYKREEGFAQHPDFLNDLIYCYYHQPDELSDEIRSYLDSMAEDYTIATDEYYKGFGADGKFNPEEELFELTEYFRKHPHTQLEDAIWEWCIVRATLGRMGFCKASAKYGIENYHLLSGDYQGEPLCSVGASFLWKYLQKAKSTDDRFKLAILMGISSLIGSKRKWVATTKEMIMCRAFGCKNPKALQQLTKSSKQASELFEKYSTRRIFEKFRTQLLSEGLIETFFGYGRRTYISITKPFDEIKVSIAMEIAKKQQKEAARSQRNELKMLLETNIKNVQLYNRVH